MWIGPARLKLLKVGHLCRQMGHEGVGDALRDGSEPNGDAGDEIADCDLQVVVSNPLQDWQTLYNPLFWMTFGQKKPEQFNLFQY